MSEYIAPQVMSGSESLQSGFNTIEFFQDKKRFSFRNKYNLVIMNIHGVQLGTESIEYHPNKFIIHSSSPGGITYIAVEDVNNIV